MPSGICLMRRTHAATCHPRERGDPKSRPLTSVLRGFGPRSWMPACAGMTEVGSYVGLFRFLIAEKILSSTAEGADAMGVRLVVAVTDGDWFDHLRARPHLTEVNFWSPSDRTFRALRPANCFFSNCTRRATSLSAAAGLRMRRLCHARSLGRRSARRTAPRRCARCAPASPATRNGRRRIEKTSYRLPDTHPALLPAGIRVDSRRRALAAQHRLVQDLLD